jgi:hypothetical protein
MADSLVSRKVSDLVGVRRQVDVERAHDALQAVAAAPQTQTQLSRGALTGYVWALGRASAAPVTGSHGHGTPSLGQIMGEIDASVMQLAEQTRRTVPRDYVQGVHDALAWVCGYSDDQPSGTR